MPNFLKLRGANGAKEEGIRIKTRTKGATKTLMQRLKKSWISKIYLNRNLTKIFRVLNLILPRITR